MAYQVFCFPFMLLKYFDSHSYKIGKVVSVVCRLQGFMDQYYFRTYSKFC